MDLEIIILTEVRQKEKDRQHMTSFITDIASRPVVANGEAVGGGMEWQVRVSRGKVYIQNG